MFETLLAHTNSIFLFAAIVLLKKIKEAEAEALAAALYVGPVVIENFCAYDAPIYRGFATGNKPAVFRAGRTRVATLRASLLGLPRFEVLEGQLQCELHVLLLPLLIGDQ